MGQTMYAIIAMMLVSLFAVQQQRHSIRTQLDMIDNEVATIASSVAVERLEEIGSVAFDQNTKDGVIDSASELTSASDFGEGQDQPGDDIDDFDGTDPDVVRTINGMQLAFATETTVTYADEDATDEPIAGPSKYKLVTVTVTVQGLDNTLYSGANGKAKSVITLSQSFSCKSACQW